MSSPILPTILRYGVAISSLVIVVSLRAPLSQFASYPSPFLLYPIAIFTCAWLCGIGLGLLATVMCAILVDYYHLPPFNDVFTYTAGESLQLGLFIVEGTLLTLLIDRLQRTRRRAELRALLLSKSEERFRILVERVKGHAILVLDANGLIDSWNQGAYRLFRYQAKEVNHQHISLLLAGKSGKDRFYPPLQHAEEHGEYEREDYCLRRNGEEFWCAIQVTPIRNYPGPTQGYEVIIRDLTDTKRTEEKMRYLALHDYLTDLPNRLFLREKLVYTIGRARRVREKFAILFLDLDRFKLINETLGHHRGDLLLKEVAERLKNCVRPQDVVTRFGGDEFLIILPDIQAEEEVVNIVKKIFSALRPACILEDHEVHVNTSIGIALYPEDGKKVESLLKNADTALFRAKEFGRNAYQFYSYTMNAQANERLQLENQLRRAFERKEFHLHYHPIVDAQSGQLLGVEALIRWHHHERGLILPQEFISVAEESGLILPLGEWVFNAVYSEQASWQTNNLTIPPVAVNLSAQQLNDPFFLSKIDTFLQRNQPNQPKLELEITESLLMQNIHENISKLKALVERGIIISVDDFGTGYSSLSYLRNLPISKLKIDRSFITNCLTDPRDSAIIQAIIGMAHSLGLKVVAEGVESEEQLTFLTQLGCDAIQGFLLTVPLPQEMLQEWIQKRQSSPGLMGSSFHHL